MLFRTDRQHFPWWKTLKRHLVGDRWKINKSHYPVFLVGSAVALRSLWLSGFILALNHPVNTLKVGG